MYETFDHTADIGLRARSETLEGLLAEAAKALFSVLCANSDAVERVRSVQFHIEHDTDSPDDLLFDWLCELLYAFDTEHMLFRDFDVQLNNGALTATAYGEPIDESRHELDMDVKAITYHGLKVEQQTDGWLAEVIVDL